MVGEPSRARQLAGLPMAAAALLVAAALILRLAGLGRLGLVADEGHQALAVAGILEHGVPQVPAGTIYLRGAPFLYAEAAAARLLGLDERSLRLPAALFGAATVGLMLVYGRMLFGAATGLVAALLLAFSLWGLELAHYARMYTLLQLAFLGSAIAFYRAVIEGRRSYRAPAVVLMALTLVTHQLGVFVLLLFLVPAILPDDALAADLRGARRWRLLVPALLLAGLWMGYQELETRLLIRTLTPIADGFAPAAEAGADAIAALPGRAFLAFLRDHLLVPPITLAWDLRSRDQPAVIVALVLAGGLMLAALSALATRRRALLRTGWALGILGAALINQLGLALGLAGAFLVLFPGGLGELRRRPLAPALIGVGALGLFWALYLARHPAARLSGWGESHSLAAALFGYPPVGERVVSWFIAGWPAMTAVVAATLAVLLVRFVRDRRRAPCLYAAATVLMPVLAVAATREIYNESRYHFHLYPFLVALFALALVSAARFLAAAADTIAALAGRRFPRRGAVEAALVAALALLLSPDVAPAEIVRFFSRDYLTPKDPVRAILNWRPYSLFHQDHEGPARLVREQLQARDRILVIGPTYWASIYWHYIGRVDYAVSEKAERLMRDGIVVHHVTGARCIVNVEELDRVLAMESGRRLWILGDLNLLGGESRHFSPAMKARLRGLARRPLKLGRDLDTFVAQRDPGPPQETVAGASR